jgi:hypothetical protein
MKRRVLLEDLVVGARIVIKYLKAFMEVGLEGGDCIRLAQDRGRLQAHVIFARCELWGSIKGEKFRD